MTVCEVICYRGEYFMSFSFELLIAKICTLQIAREWGTIKGYGLRKFYNNFQEMELVYSMMYIYICMYMYIDESQNTEDR